jgi:signal transduction histidine kinase
VLTISDMPDRVVFSVKDDGIGIVPEARKEIFQSFFRTSRGQAKSKGDGIGLSFVQTLVELHGGEMHLESEVNKGSTFSFYIPKAAVDKTVEAEADKQA